MKTIILSTVLLFSSLSIAHPMHECYPRDEQAALAKACENAINITETRVQCLKYARLVATIKFCERQYSSSDQRLNCIKEVDTKTE